MLAAVIVCCLVTGCSNFKNEALSGEQSAAESASGSDVEDAAKAEEAEKIYKEYEAKWKAEALEQGMSEEEYDRKLQIYYNDLKMVRAISEKISDEEDRVIGSVLGEDVYEKDFLTMYAQSKIQEEENPYESAVNIIKNRVAEAQYAKENGIYPSEKEVEAYTAEQRELSNDEEGKAIFDNVARLLGVSVDEYWNKIKPEGDRKALIHTAVVNDLYNKTGEKELDISDVEFKLTDSGFTEEKVAAMVAEIEAEALS